MGRAQAQGPDTWVLILTSLCTCPVAFSKLFIPVSWELWEWRSVWDMMDSANGNHYYYAKARHYNHHYNDFLKNYFQS